MSFLSTKTFTYHVTDEPPMYETDIGYRPTKKKGLAIAWLDLSFYSRLMFFAEPKLILNRISGCVDFGQLIALMGPSGAGKTTLLKTINGRHQNLIDSNIYLSANYKIRPCFIVQDVSEHLLHGLTAMQSLVYASKLKNCGKVCDHKLNARNLLAELMIQDTEKTPVENCSGGEQKRIAIAMELTALEKPNLICIDEPTSGLDSNAAQVVVECLQALTRQHYISIVTSIHQPNQDVLFLFDKLYVLAKGGVCAFEGTPHDLAEHLHKSGIEVQEEEVPIEVLLRETSIRGENINNLVAQMKTEQTYLSEKCQVEGRYSPKGVPQKRARFSVKRTWYLLSRNFTYAYIAQWKMVVAQFVIIVSCGAIIPVFFNNHVGEPDSCIDVDQNLFDVDLPFLEENREKRRRTENMEDENFKFLFFTQISMEFLILVATVLLFAYEIKIFVNEHSNRWYSTGSYFWSKMIVEIPLCVMISMVYQTCVYWESDQINEWGRYLGWVALAAFSGLCAQGLGFAVGILAKSNMNLAMVLAIAVYLLWVMLSGFMSPIDDLADPLQWLTYTPFTRNIFDCRAILIYGFDRCDEDQESRVLLALELDHDTTGKFWQNAGTLIFQFAIYRIAGLIFLLISVNPVDIPFSFGKRPSPPSGVVGEPPVNPVTTYI